MDKGETFRGGVHALTASLACAMALYNAMAYTERQDRRSALNVLVYAGLWWFELAQTRRHWTEEP